MSTRCKILTILSMLILAACNSGGSSGTNPVPLDSDPSDDSEVGSDVFNLSNTRWFSTCFLMQDGHPDSGDAYQQAEVIFSGDVSSFDTHVRVYELDNTSCLGDESFIFSATYNIEVGNLITTTDGVEAYELDSELVFESTPDTWDAQAYDLIYRDLNTLYFGLSDNEDGPITEELRPTAINFENPYTLTE